MKLLISLCSMLLSYLGWYLAEPIGLIWAFFLSSIGALAGVYLGWKIGRHFEL